MQDRARLRGRQLFSRVYSQGRTWSSPLLGMKVLPNGLPTSRFGFAVGRAQGKAVARNRMRRRLREIARRAPVPAGWDIVLVPRARAAGAGMAELREAFHALLRRSGLLEAG